MANTSSTDRVARQQLLHGLAQAADDLGRSLAALSGAYELLDDAQAERLERELFGPVQRAYGRAQRTHAGFAQRHRLARRRFHAPAPGAPSTGVSGLVEQAVDAIERADTALIALQDASMFVEVGDPELRAGVTEVRQLIDRYLLRARAFLRTFGR
ncbi:MAG: hypothetical protein FWD42_04985, partial [Solirubrobacterales bacterium]|nr:hypothetical protein [Solirubrobacterales bacterium]